MCCSLAESGSAHKTVIHCSRQNEGRFQAEQVIGIVAVNSAGQPIRPDGKIAVAEKESVVVAIPHSMLIQLQQPGTPLAMRFAWNGLNGQRMGMLRRKRKSSKRERSQPDTLE